MAVGLRIEAAVIARIDENDETGNAKANASYLATGDFYYSNKRSGLFSVQAPVFSHSQRRFGQYTTTDDDEKNGYFGLKLEVVIGGGRR